jgi:hypothetical protein
MRANTNGYSGLVQYILQLISSDRSISFRSARGRTLYQPIWSSAVVPFGGVPPTAGGVRENRGAGAA